MKRKVSISHACNVVRLLGHSHSKVQQLASPWLHHRQWTSRDHKPRGAAAAKYMAEKKEKGRLLSWTSSHQSTSDRLRCGWTARMRMGGWSQSDDNRSM